MNQDRDQSTAEGDRQWNVPGSTHPERLFAEWLNDQRMKSVSEVFHDIVRRYREALDSPVQPKGANPNNCQACDHKRNPDGGWCYMFRDEPTDVCAKHTARTSLQAPAPVGEVVEMDDGALVPVWRDGTPAAGTKLYAGPGAAPAPAQKVPPGWVFEKQAEPLEGHLRIQDPSGRYVYVGADCLDTTERMLFDLATAISQSPAVGADDAKRLDWLEQQRSVSLTQMHLLTKPGPLDYWCIEDWDGDDATENTEPEDRQTLRAAIDAAMAAKPPVQGSQP